MILCPFSTTASPALNFMSFKLLPNFERWCQRLYLGRGYQWGWATGGGGAPDLLPAPGATPSTSSPRRTRYSPPSAGPPRFPTSDSLLATSTEKISGSCVQIFFETKARAFSKYKNSACRLTMTTRWKQNSIYTSIVFLLLLSAGSQSLCRPWKLFELFSLLKAKASRD